MNPVIAEIDRLYHHDPESAYFGEAVTKLQHAEQAAFHATQAGADEELILAALLHDIGHLLEGGQRHQEIGVIDHDQRAGQWLRQHGFGERLAQLVAGHVNAKRYLVATNAAYRGRLSNASQRTLELQGGPMTEAEAAAFAADPLLRDHLRLRSWDEMAKDPAAQVPPFRSYLERLAAYLAPSLAGH